MSDYCVHCARLQQPWGYYCAPCIPPRAHRSSAALQWLNPLPWRGLMGVLNRLCSIRFGPASASPSPPTPPSCIGHSDAVNAHARVYLPSAVKVVKAARPFVERHSFIQSTVKRNNKHKRIVSCIYRKLCECSLLLS